MNIQSEIIERLKTHNMKYAAMDYDHKWYAFEKKPNWVDGSWDVKYGQVMRLHLAEHEHIDNRKSLISL
jgi:hypothetical protein